MSGLPITRAIDLSGVGSSTTVFIETLQFLELYGTKNMSGAGNVVIVSNVTPSHGHLVFGRFRGTLNNYSTGSGDVLKIFGVTIPDELATQEFYFIAHYSTTASAWGLLILPDWNGTGIVTADQLASDVVTTAKIIDNAVTLAKMNDLAQGSIIVGGTSNAPTALPAETDAYILIGDGTDLNSVAVTGVIGIDNTGLTTFTAGAITASALDTALKTEVLTVPISWETGGIGTFLIKMPYACTITDIYICVTTTIEATDNATVDFKDHSTASMYAPTFSAGDTIGTVLTSAVAADNAFTAGQLLRIETSKTTPGGTALATLKIVRS